MEEKHYFSDGDFYSQKCLIESHKTVINDKNETKYLS